MANTGIFPQISVKDGLAQTATIFSTSTVLDSWVSTRVLGEKVVRLSWGVGGGGWGVVS